MQLAYIEDLYSRHLISEAEYVALKEQHKQPVSLYTDLHILLYTGVLFLATGLGILIYKNIDSVGHGVVVAIIALLCAGCFAFCLKKSPGFTTSKQPAANAINDYVLLLGCLLLLTLTGYLQYQFNLFGDNWGLATFIPMIVLFLVAYYFDHLGILSLAITNLAAWLGITVTPLYILKSNDFSNTHLIYAGIILGIGLYIIAYLTQKKNLKAHFSFAYQNFGVHLSYICLLAGVFHYERFYFIWFLIIAGLTICVCQYALRIKSYYFFVVAVLYSYVALIYTTYKLLDLLKDDVFFYLYSFWIILSGIVLIRLLIRYNKIIKHDTGI